MSKTNRSMQAERERQQQQRVRLTSHKMMNNQTSAEIISN
jgi:hypothetical protein